MLRYVLVCKGLYFTGFGWSSGIWMTKRFMTRYGATLSFELARERLVVGGKEAEIRIQTIEEGETNGKMGT